MYWIYSRKSRKIYLEVNTYLKVGNLLKEEDRAPLVHKIKKKKDIKRDQKQKEKKRKEKNRPATSHSRPPSPAREIRFAHPEQII